ncbi:MAG: hypothetical protein WCP55_18210 [Lentisphaerota bacterium]
MRQITRLLLLLLAPLGTILFSGCSSVGTTVNPEFDISNYQRVYTHYVGYSSFISSEIDEVFVKYGFGYLNNRRDFKEHDLFVIVTVDVGFLLPPSLSRHLDLVFTQPKKATVEIQDAMTRKQLLLCTYRRWFGNIGSFDYCEEDVVAELTRVLNELKAKSKPPAPLPAPDDQSSPK